MLTRLYLEFKETKSITLPPHLLPLERGYNLLAWARELYEYYRCENCIVRPFDELPPLKLSAEAGLPVTIQDVHAFIINDLNLLPPRFRQQLFGTVLDHDSAEASWQAVKPLLLDYLRRCDPDDIQEDPSWHTRPVAELLVALTWFFIEQLEILPPAGVTMCCNRFPFSRWRAAPAGFWVPEPGLCRWKWLALDLYRDLCRR